MILVCFIDEIEKHIQEKKIRKDERESIRRFDQVLKLYIEQYVLLFYCVATPLESRKFDNIEMPNEFKLKDMRDLHLLTLLVKENPTSSSVEAFLEIELGLRRQIISIIEKFDFEYYSAFKELFLDFIRVSLKYDSRKAILFNQSLEQQARFVSELLKNNADEYLAAMLRGEHMSGNLAHPYIFLYLMMNEERDIILHYQQEIKNLEKE